MRQALEIHSKSLCRTFIPMTSQAAVNMLILFLFSYTRKYFGMLLLFRTLTIYGRNLIHFI
jgi:hypothetical protein